MQLAHLAIKVRARADVWMRKARSVNACRRRVSILTKLSPRKLVHRLLRSFERATDELRMRRAVESLRLAREKVIAEDCTHLIVRS